MKRKVNNFIFLIKTLCQALRTQQGITNFDKALKMM